VKKISIRGGVFNLDTRNSKFVDIVIVNAAEVGRAYYKGTYNPDVSVAPTCWSLTTQRPANDVPTDQKQATRCMDCRQNIRGSGSYGGRACRYFQRIAVVFEDKLDEVYQLQLPAASIYGRASNSNKMSLQQYVKHIDSRGEKVSYILTRIYFDTDSNIHKLCFKPLRRLDNEELLVIQDVMDGEDVKQAVTFTSNFIPNSMQNGSLFEETEGFKINADKRK
jgi:hypothetical protein